MRENCSGSSYILFTSFDGAPVGAPRLVQELNMGTPTKADFSPVCRVFVSGAQPVRDGAHGPRGAGDAMARPLLCTPPAPPHAGGQGKGGADRSLLVRLCEGGRTLRLASIGILMRFLSWEGGDVREG